MTTISAISALAIDELRALSRLAGWPLPPMLQEEREAPAADEEHAEHEAPADGDAVWRDVVAVRCMLAHGVLRLVEAGTGGQRVEAAPGVTHALAALRAPDLLVEVETEVGGDLVRHVLAEGGGATLRLSEREPDVWAVTAEATPAAPIVGGIVSAHVAGCAPPTGAELVLSVADHVRVDALVLEGFADEVEPALLAAGVAAGPAASWTAALTRRSGAGAVRVARRARASGREGGRDGGCDGGDVRWVAAGAHGLWLLEESPDAATTWIHDVAPAAVAAALAGLLPGLPADGHEEVG
jgi:hypothetical protein